MENKNPQAKIDLSDFFITRSQANDFTIKLNKVIEHMYTANFHLEETLQTQFGIQKTDAFLKLLRENSINTTSLHAVQDFFKRIQATVSSLQQVTLVIAFEPTDETLKTFSQWFVFNLNTQVLFDIQTDPSLVAGVKITYNGKFKDYSVNSLFTNLVTGMLTPHQANQIPQQLATPVLHQSTQHLTIGR